MRKMLISAIILIASITTIYAVAFWSPEEEVTSVIGSEEMKGQEDKAKNEYSNESLLEKTELEEVQVVNKSIFKMDKGSIEENITKDSIEKINNIIRKMSTVDIERVEQAIKYSDKEQGAREALKILEKRLSSDDYKNLKSILTPYIDFSIIGQEV